MSISRTLASLALACICLTASTAFAQAPVKKIYGKGNPFAVEDLPAGKLKTKLKTLNPKARQKAMDELHKFTFADFDAEFHLRADQNGGVFYVCPDDHGNCDGHSHRHSEPEASDPGTANADTLVESPQQTTESPLVAQAAVSIYSPPAYHSKPGATRHIYLDFNGAYVTGKEWNVEYGRAAWNCGAWNPEGDATTFSDAEQTAMRQIWERIAEDYAPFDVNVTTDVAYDSVNYTGDKNKVGWILFTKTIDKNGVPCPHYNTGGTAYVSKYGDIDYFSKFQPVWVLTGTALGTGSEGISQAANMAEGGSHEMGHNMGLSHDGTTAGEYYNGHAAVVGVAPSWGPIMGFPNNRNVSQWNKGEYYSANQPQDDLFIIQGRVPYRADDHGSDFNNAVEWSGSSVNQSGIIERTNDSDYFKFTTGTGVINLNANSYRCAAGTWGGNLDIQLELYDNSRNLIASNNPAAETNASISTSVSIGTYYLVVKPSAAGNPFTSTPSGYTIYGSLGQYSISGNLVPINSPEIAVEQPEGMDLADGGAIINFGSVNVGSSSPLTITIRNAGTANLTGLTLSINGANSADYTLGNFGATMLDPGASTTFEVTFSPGVIGTRTAAIEITSNDANENPFNINLTGTGLGPGTLSVSTGDFYSSGNYAGAFSPLSKVYTLSNPGGTPINWTANKTENWVTLSAISGTLASGASVDVTVSIYSYANSLNSDNYNDTVAFTNSTSGTGNTTRSVTLAVNPIPVTITLGNLSSTYDGSPKAVSVITNPANLPYSLTYAGSDTVPTHAGTYAVVATITNSNYIGSASGNLVVAKAAQMLTFAAFPDPIFDTVAPFVLTGSASSGLAVSYTSSNTAVAMVSGNTLTVVGPGITTITASPVDSINFIDVPPVPRELMVLQTNPVDAVIYEPFGDTNSTLDGNAAGQGLSGTWLGTGAVVASSLIHAKLPPSIGGAAFLNNKNGYVSTGFTLSAAGLMNDGASLWFSVLVNTGSDIDTGDLGFALGTDQINGGNGIPVQNNGYALGFTFMSNQLRAAHWVPNNLTRSSTNSGNGASPNTLYLVIGKITWGASSETIEIYRPSPNRILGNAVSTYTAPNLNQSLFDTLSFGSRGANFTHQIDEIRFGASYESVIDLSASIAVDHFAISSIDSPQTVGTPITGVTITAMTAADVIATSFTGTVTFGGTAGITGTSASFVNGVLNVLSVTPTVVGSNLTFTVDDGAAHSGSRNFNVQGLYNVWSSNGSFANTFIETAPTDNPDGDILSNLQEFAFNTDPTSSVLRPLSFAIGGEVTDAGIPVIMNFATDSNPPDYRAVFIRRKNHLAAGLTYAVEFTADLDMWTGSATAPTVLTNPASISVVEAVSVPYPAAVPLNGGGNNRPPQFFRVAVSQN